MRSQWKTGFRRLSLAVTLAALAIVAVLTVLLPRSQPVSEHLAVTGGAASAADADPATTAATPVPATYADQPYPATAVAPTKDKPQSKLWFNDGSWWSLMIGASDQRVRIHELQRDHTWRDTGVVVDERPSSTADVLWDGTQLLIASRTGTGQIRLVRLGWVAAGRTYRVLPGFPVVIADGGAPSVAIAEDSIGRVWTTFIQHDHVYIAHTDPGITRISTPTPLPVEVSRATADDVSSIVALGKGIAVMWSDQATGQFRFVLRQDADPPGTWQPTEIPLSGDHMVDGHVNMVALEDGRLLAAVKTSLDDAKAPADAPLIEVLVRSPDGKWTANIAGQVGDRMTRPVLLVDPASQLALLFSTSPEHGGAIYYKASALDQIGFSQGRGVPFVSHDGAVMNNPTAVKGILPEGAPIVVLASDDAEHRYYHAELPAR